MTERRKHKIIASILALGGVHFLFIFIQRLNYMTEFITFIIYQLIFIALAYACFSTAIKIITKKMDYKQLSLFQAIFGIYFGYLLASLFNSLFFFSYMGHYAFRTTISLLCVVALNTIVTKQIERRFGYRIFITSLIASTCIYSAIRIGTALIYNY